MGLADFVSLGTDADLCDPEIFRKYRTQVREALLAEQILGADADLNIELRFSGSGDSGDWESHHEEPHVQHLFDYLLNNHVTFDWYNNDGGGGTVTWDVEADVITIDGYWNETVSHDAPTVVLSADGEEDGQDGQDRQDGSEWQAA